jgi:hypothetical protein
MPDGYHKELETISFELDGESVTIFGWPPRESLTVDGITSRQYVNGNQTMAHQPMFITTSTTSLKGAARMRCNLEWTPEDEYAWLKAGWLD